MSYTVISGRYETGTKEQQFEYIHLFGEENIQYKFDLYFHWYNLVHEMGHCLVEKQDVEMSKVKEEMYVNEFAAGYYFYVGEKEKLKALQEIIQSVIDRLPAPMPEGESFTDYYERIWNTDEINNVMIYGYFQLNSVLEAMKKNRSLENVLSEIGISINTKAQLNKCQEKVSSENAEVFLHTALNNLKLMRVDVPDIKLKLVENPMMQFATTDDI